MRENIYVNNFGRSTVATSVSTAISTTTMTAATTTLKEIDE